jgi:hypothetical protein
MATTIFLRAHLVTLALLTACDGPKTVEPPPTCATAPLPEGHRRAQGAIWVPVGEPCPSITAELEVAAFECCPTLTPVDVCRFVERGQTGVEVVLDTATGPRPRDQCVYEAIFEEGTACCGRPLLRDDAPVVAGLVSGDRWRAGSSAHTPDPVAAAHWREAARMEHASIASFARSTLELLRFGAPPELVERSQRAGLDETAHARLCFALAATLADEPLDPGPLDLPSLALASDRVAFAEAVAREGCVGETLAVVDAAVRRRQATDPAVQAVLDRIVDEEAAHARLAWDTLRWLLADDPDGAVRARLDAVFATPTVPAYSGPTAPHLGVPEPAALHRAVASTWERVIVPTWLALRG